MYWVCPKSNIQCFTTVCQHLFCMLVLFPASCLPLVAFEFCLWPGLYSWFLYIMGSYIPCQCDPPNLPAALPNRCSVHLIFFFFLGMLHIVATHFLLKTRRFCCLPLIPGACSHTVCCPPCSFLSKNGNEFPSFPPPHFSPPLCWLCRYSKHIKPKHNGLILLQLETPSFFPLIVSPTFSGL